MTDWLTLKPKWLCAEGQHLCHDDTASRITTVRDFEKWLRLHGWPHKAAKTIATRGFAVLIGELGHQADRSEALLLLQDIQSQVEKVLANQNKNG